MAKDGNKTGTKEWAETTVNCVVGCSHDCRYCYAREMAERYGRVRRGLWQFEKPDFVRVHRKYGKKKGRIMFPSAHDITPAVLPHCLVVLESMLKAGNDVLIVSKPHTECITAICWMFEEFKEKIEFRFTIGSADNDILRFWEPGAPDFAERLSCLKHAFDNGFKTSVSCEPYLDAYVVYTYSACLPYLTESFWVGKLRDFKRRVDTSGLTQAELEQFDLPLQAVQSDYIVRSIYGLLDGQRFIKWKDSFRKVIGI